ncbi:MAG: response regulator [bacterium]
MKKRRILIIEDDKNIAESLNSILTAKGYETILAADGSAGIEDAKKLRPALILLDLMLPRMSGFDVCQVLKSNEETAGIPIMVTTALGKMEDVEKAFACGASDYIIKPFDLRHLLEKVDKLIAEEKA